MQDTFTLKIDLGNAAMSSPEDVAGALESVAAKVRDGRDEGGIRDLNGNTVGRWTVSYPALEDDD